MCTIRLWEFIYESMVISKLLNLSVPLATGAILLSCLFLYETCVEVDLVAHQCVAGLTALSILRHFIHPLLQVLEGPTAGDVEDLGCPLRKKKDWEGARGEIGKGFSNKGRERESEDSRGSLESSHSSSLMLRPSLLAATSYAWPYSRPAGEAGGKN